MLIICHIHNFPFQLGLNHKININVLSVMEIKQHGIIFPFWLKNVQMTWKCVTAILFSILILKHRFL